jgi:hypothetical protein
VRIDIDTVRNWLSAVGPAPPFVTFWHGPLDPITYTCLATFPRRGIGLRVYSYDPKIELPGGVQRADARRIVPDETLLDRYKVGGRASASIFSDYFRYMAISRTGSCWVDSDVICLRRHAYGRNALVFGYQGRKKDGPWALNGAVLKLPRRHPMLQDLLLHAAAAVDEDSRWGTIGPLLITEAAHRHGVIDQAQPLRTFYPITFGGFWKMLVPERKAEVRRASASSSFLHLWRESYRQAGYDESVAPPEGSYLHDLCRKLGTLDRFSRTYRRDELRDVLAAHVKD